MLASIPAWKWEEWKAFYELEPDPYERIDWGLAHVVQAIARSDAPLSAFRLPFGDNPKYEPPTQSAEYIEMRIAAWCDTSNAVIHESGPPEPPNRHA